MPVNLDTHFRRGHPVVFTLLIIFSIIELAISGWLVARFNSHHNFMSISVRDRTRFLLFCSAWTILLSSLYAGFFWLSASVFTSVLSHLIFLFVTWVLWLAGAASITAALGGGLDCGNHFTYCGQLNALEAFAWIIWVLTFFAFFSVILRAVSASRRGDGMGGQLVP
ncbi:uncharacterized protein FIBRA_00050 [Fibroporia radiculosa]|uniref:MARVEL domain-containing protein n=1 Tax=Fibroporia radiculosa TaxID=599839 RepID=J7SBR5_9APHY|nr:uncharacterized protein FIBRA_00050 [Fibroporia radiculosa]CCL98056.1 predicted protein [Fibroporia radiculosa]